MTDANTADATPLFIDTDILRAAHICACDDGHRYYISGVYIDPQGYVVSTDGHRLFCARFDLMAGPDGTRLKDQPIGFGGFIIPRDILKRVLTGNKQRVIELTSDVIDGQRYMPIDGTFPDWRRVVPGDELSGVTAQFNPDYVADMGKIGKLLTGAGKGTLRATIHHNGDAPAGVTFGDYTDAFGVLMPIRANMSGKDSDWKTARSIV